MVDQRRFAPISPDDLTEDQRRVARALTASPRGEVRGPYIPLLYSPDLADRMRLLGDFIRFGGMLDARIKELLVLLSARRWSAHYIFAVHREFSRDAGLPVDVADAIAIGQRPLGLSRAEAAAYDVGSELLGSGEVGDQTFSAAREQFGEAGVIEIVAFVGYYTTLAMIVNCGRLPLPAGGSELPAARP
jgi:4-carboxymuconolactone decarboxylase